MTQSLRQLLKKFPFATRLRSLAADPGAFPVGHYHSPIPSRKDVHEQLARAASQTVLADVDLRQSEQLALIEEFAAYYPDLPFPEKQGEGRTRYFYDQGWFVYSDAIMLYCMIRKFGFKRIVEVGSGFSSAVMLDTLESLNRHDTELTFIDPYPGRLTSLVDVDSTANVRLIKTGVQDTELRLFESLEEGDLLFIDSSHVVKFGSDLHFLFFNVLPVLKKGVFVHFHDIFFPFEYPKAWSLEGRYWNECYFLRAFLSGNRDWRIVLFNDFANQVFGDVIANRMPLCRKNFGGSIYLQKVG